VPSQIAERERAPFPLEVIINPVLTLLGEATRTYAEGCLSVPGYVALVERLHRVHVAGFDEGGKPVQYEAAGWKARILQHEVDHLDGILYVDRMRSRSLCTNEKWEELWMHKTTAEVRAELGDGT
jgi:peptide deformylase